MTDELSDPGFSYKVRKSGDVEVLHCGKLAATLRGRDAADFLAKAERSTESQAQMLMARVTGNYKRGNERIASQRLKRCPTS
jgi:hypothetical protein